MNAGQLNMLHDSRYKGVGSVTDGICLTLHRVMQETVNQNRTIRSHSYRCTHIFLQALRLMDNLHTTAAQYIRRTHHNRITDALGNFQSFLHINGHTCLRHGDIQLLHDGAELIPILCQVDDLRAGSQNPNSILFQICCQIQWRLSAELGNNTYRLLLLVDT